MASGFNVCLRLFTWNSRVYACRCSFSAESSHPDPIRTVTFTDLERGGGRRWSNRIFFCAPSKTRKPFTGFSSMFVIRSRGLIVCEYSKLRAFDGISHCDNAPPPPGYFSLEPHRTPK